MSASGNPIVSNELSRPAAAFYTADEVARILRLARPTVYEIAREEPARLGAETFGRRCVRFRRATIDAIVNGG